MSSQCEPHKIMKNYRILVTVELINISGKFQKASWKRKEIHNVYPSLKKAKELHNLNNCNYHYINEYDEIIKSFINANMDAYGTRYNGTL